MPGPGLVLSTYLNDHYAAAVAAAELARRMSAQRRGGPDAEEFAALAGEVADDARALRVILSELGVPVRRYKTVAAWLGEKVGRLKLNGRVRAPSPASPVVELDGLGMLITARAGVWRTLLTVARHDDRLDERELIELLGRADRQEDTVRRLQGRAAETAFGAAEETVD